MRFESAFDVLEEHRRRSLPKGFCVVPFTSLILEPDGKVGSCRHKGSEFPVGNILDSSLDEIWNGPFIRDWRRQFLSGEVKNCETEVRHRACHLCPDYNELLPHASLDEVQSRRPLRLGLNFNGQCNLECQMCHIWQKPNGLYDKIGFWEKLADYCRDLREVELLSGEPFVQKDTYRLIDLLSEVNPSCRWTITTNAHWKLTDRIRRSLDRIRFKSLIVSIDSVVPETYARIRKKGRLDVVLSNLDLLTAYDRDRQARGLGSLGIRLNFLYQKDNWRELKTSHAFESERGLPTFRTFCYEPLEHSILSLGEAEREEILETYFRELDFDELSRSMRVILPILDSLPPLARCQHLDRLKTIRRSA
jgi:radical SAM protein with 4Fe4S-binding SPASM domain